MHATLSPESRQGWLREANGNLQGFTTPFDKSCFLVVCDIAGCGRHLRPAKQSVTNIKRADASGLQCVPARRLRGSVMASDQVQDGGKKLEPRSENSMRVCKHLKSNM
jgi:hypothetical protein